MRKKVLTIAASILALAALPVVAGEWHSGTTNLCSDCHTMHFSMQHNWDGTTPVPTTPAPNGNWLGTVGPNEFLLKAPANQLCLACHDGQTFAPDVLGTNTNASPSQGRMAGALNDAALGAPYEMWKGHTLDSTDTPPGFDPTVIGASATWYDPAGGLECTNCHAQHGPTTAYRNLGPYSLGGAAGVARPTYVISNTNTATQDVWINLASYTANSGTAATFNPYYDFASISYNRNDTVLTAGNTYANRIENLCAACHGDFHGAPGDANVGADPAALDAFIRHPSAVTLGAAGAQGYGGHSSLTRYAANTTKVKVYSDAAGYTDASPGCISCHKAHGNQNPFGLFFLNRDATAVNEQGGWNLTQTQNLMQGYRNLCGQCHGQGN